jgi:hypothetical protein
MSRVYRFDFPTTEDVSQQILMHKIYENEELCMRFFEKCRQVPELRNLNAPSLRTDAFTWVYPYILGNLGIKCLCKDLMHSFKRICAEVLMNSHNLEGLFPEYFLNDGGAFGTNTTLSQGSIALVTTSSLTIRYKNVDYHCTLKDGKLIFYCPPR